ncbi:Uncharacterised protein [Bordetella pertussis]|nr:Uncharacterised protein [Bordetella pertussis]CFN48502.1 Uncharacterised protein [Bordetella pertussis]CPN17614.1 Uncharacterised protein [Bordetella pertussis]
MPGASTNSYGAPLAAASAALRPMKRLTETMVFSGSRACSSRASRPIRTAPPSR